MNKSELIMDQNVLDARGLLCPIPVIRTQDRIRDLNHEDTLLVLATDPGVEADIPAWCRIHGHDVVSMQQVGHEFHIKVRVRKTDEN